MLLLVGGGGSNVPMRPAVGWILSKDVVDAGWQNKGFGIESISSREGAIGSSLCRANVAR